jgi:coproporphyrinogen III oxidase
LTPSYLVEEDVKAFHGSLKAACDQYAFNSTCRSFPAYFPKMVCICNNRHDVSYFPKFKKWADEYFTITHRGETRGVGGIFFDDLDDKSPTELYNFISTMGAAVVPSYFPISKRDTVAHSVSETFLFR